MFSSFYEPLLFATTAVGAAVGGWIDFKTSEIPDEVPLFIALSALGLHIANGVFGNGWGMLTTGLLVGIIYLALGYLLYYSGQWGEADVLLLAAIGFALPQPLSFFNAMDGYLYPVLFLLNTFIVGAFYSIAYSVAKAAMIKGFFSHFISDLKKNVLVLCAIVAIFSLTILGIAFSFDLFSAAFLLESSLYVAGVGMLYLLYRFAHTVDAIVFRAKISTTHLREGDVLAEHIPELSLSSRLFIGLTQEQVKAIKKKKKHVLVKEGVRYAPTFFLSILFTLFFGNALILLFGAL